MNLKTILTTTLLILILFNTTGYGFLSYTIYNETTVGAVTAASNIGNAIISNHKILFYVLGALHLATFGLAGAIVYKV